MKKSLLIAFCLSFSSCAWIKSHPQEIEEIEMTAEQVALQAAIDLIKKEYGIIIPIKTNQSIAEAK